jgi:hypothetical protein
MAGKNIPDDSSLTLADFLNLRVSDALKYLVLGDREVR